MNEARFGRYTREEVLSVFRELEFNTIAQRIPAPLGEEPSEARSAGDKSPAPASTQVLETEVILVDTTKALEAMAKELSKASVVAFDTETTSTNPMEADLVGLSFAVTPGVA